MSIELLVNSESVFYDVLYNFVHQHGLDSGIVLWSSKIVYVVVELVC